MRMPWRTKKEPCGGIERPVDNNRELKERLARVENELKKLHKVTYGDKSEYHENLLMKYNGEANEFTFGAIKHAMITCELPPVSQEEALGLAEFILDNYKGDNK